MGCCSSAPVEAIPGMDTRQKASETFGVFFAGGGSQGKRTLHKHICQLYGDNNHRRANDFLDRMQDNVITNAKALATAPQVMALFSKFELLKAAKRAGVTVSDSDVQQVTQGILESVLAYTHAFEKALKPINAFVTMDFTWPDVLKTPSRPSPKGIAQQCKAQEPTSDSCLQEIMDQAAEAQFELMRLLVGEEIARTWKPRDKATGDTGLLLPGLTWVDEAFNPGLKGTDRIKIKAAYKYNHDLRQVKDIARVALQFHTFEKLQIGLTHVLSCFGDDVLELDNRFIVPTGLGWRDISMLVKVFLPKAGVWHICEIQLHHTELANARKKAHSYYRKIREVLETIVPPAQQSQIFDPELTKAVADIKYTFGSAVPAADVEHLKEFYSYPEVVEIGLRECLKHPAMTYDFEYFVTRIHQIFDENYEVTTEDLLHVRLRTTGIFSENISFGQKNLRLFMPGGQRSERRKWVNVYDSVEVVLFFVSLIDYDMVLWEDWEANRMQDDFELFENLCSNAMLSKKTFVAVLTMPDSLAKKLEFSPPTADCTALEGYTGEATDANGLTEFVKDKLRSIANSRNVDLRYTVVANPLQPDDCTKVLSAIDKALEPSVPQLS